MARRKKPDNETPEQTADRHTIESVSNHATRSEKTSWNRMMDNMVALMSKLTPIENAIIELYAKKIPLIDQIQALRDKMVKECVHPYEQLVLKDGVVECKFCQKKFKVQE